MRVAGEGFALRHRQTVWLVMHTLGDQPREPSAWIRASSLVSSGRFETTVSRTPPGLTSVVADCASVKVHFRGGASPCSTSTAGAWGDRQPTRKHPGKRDVHAITCVMALVSYSSPER